MDFSLSPTWPELATRFPRGRDVYLPHLTHFIPMQDPALVARFVADVEAVVRTLQGEPRHVLVKWSVAPGHEETCHRVLVSLVDMTGRVRAEEARSESEERLRGIFETASEGIWVIDTDTITI